MSRFQQKYMLLGLLAASVFCARSAVANIYQWQYIDPANPSLGKQQSATLAPGGNGVTAAPNADLGGRNLTMAYLPNADLSNANFAGTNFTNGYLTGATLKGSVSGDFTSADLSNANLAYAQIFFATLVGTDFHGANLSNALIVSSTVDSADFSNAQLSHAQISSDNISTCNFSGATIAYATLTSTFTLSQLYSTASYQTGDLRGVTLGADLANGAFASKNLSTAQLNYLNIKSANFNTATLANASFLHSNLTDATFSGATATTANFEQADLTNVDFTNANLNGATFTDSTLATANFTNANVAGAQFASVSHLTSLTSSQLYSTASYQNKNLAGILINGDLTGWNLSGQNLTGATFSRSILVNTILDGANLDNAFFFQVTAPSLDFRTASLHQTAFSAAALTGAKFDGNAISGSAFSETNLTNASFLNVDASSANFNRADLTGVSFAGSNLSHANFSSAVFSNTNVADADVRYANFSAAFSYGFTLASLYSTASYQAHDLTGINLGANTISSANFANQNLTSANFSTAKLSNASFLNATLANANFASASLIGADFTDANISGAKFTGNSSLTLAQLYSTASYKQHNLNKINLGIDLTGGDLSQQDLRGADLSASKLASVNFSQARVERVTFPSTPSAAITPAQLYSTRSYSEFSLHGINISAQSLNGWNFRDQDLTSALFFSTIFTNSDFSRADLRGSLNHPTNYAGNTLTNAIRNDGTVQGLNLAAGDTLRIRDYDANDVPAGAPTGLLPIRIKNSFAMDSGSTLKFTFEADNWDSAISFDPSIVVQRAGTLDLGFAPEVFVPSQIGRTFQLFNWSGVTPTGAFNVSSPYTWDLSNLYTTGAVTLLQVPFVPGDFNQDGTVDSSDYVLWRNGLGVNYSQQEYTAWRTHFGYSSGSGTATSTANVPEPPISPMLLIGATLSILSHRAPSQPPLAV